MVGSSLTGCGAVAGGRRHCSPRWRMRRGPMPEGAGSLEDLLSSATNREVWQPADTKSGARFERLIIDGARYVLKYQDPRDDWLLRASGDPGERYVLLWERGL